MRSQAEDDQVVLDKDCRSRVGGLRWTLWFMGAFVVASLGVSGAAFTVAYSASSKLDVVNVQLEIQKELLKEIKEDLRSLRQGRLAFKNE